MDQFQGKKNGYICQDCGCRIVTVDRDAGVTPFSIGCRRGCCKGLMYSSFYRVPQDLEASWEWYRAEDGEVRAMPPGCWEHHRQGGLFLRKIAETAEKDSSGRTEEHRVNMLALAEKLQREMQYEKAMVAKMRPIEPEKFAGNRHERRRAAKVEK